MARTATVSGILIASPSDLGEERLVIREAIDQWNIAHGWGKNAMFEPIIGQELKMSPAVAKAKLEELSSKHFLTTARFFSASDEYELTGRGWVWLEVCGAISRQAAS